MLPDLSEHKNVIKFESAEKLNPPMEKRNKKILLDTHHLTHGDRIISHNTLSETHLPRQLPLVGTLQIEIDITQHLLVLVVLGLFGVLLGVHRLGNDLQLPRLEPTPLQCPSSLRLSIPTGFDQTVADGVDLLHGRASRLGDVPEKWNTRTRVGIVRCRRSLGCIDGIERQRSIGIPTGIVKL